jgi:hypothetical protein
LVSIEQGGEKGETGPFATDIIVYAYLKAGLETGAKAEAEARTVAMQKKVFITAISLIYYEKTDSLSSVSPPFDRHSQGRHTQRTQSNKQRMYRTGTYYLHGGRIIRCSQTRDFVCRTW